MKKLLFYCLCFVAFSSFVLDNSNGFSDLIRNKLASYANNHWPEKIYVHTDKSYYTLNDDLWFSAYLVNGITHRASSKSAVIYVELINANDSIVDSKRLYINQLSSAGHFKIADSWTPGNYLLRAYTNYMRNEGSETFFQKEFQIVSIDEISKEQERQEKPNDSIISKNQKKPDLQFYPEGGHLVENISTKVAIKIKDQQLHGRKIPIEIVDSQGSVLSKLTSVEFGLGFFFINPKANTDYYANLNVDGKIFQYALPKALVTGYSLNVNFKNKDLLIGINSNKESGLKNSYLLIHQRGNVLYDKVMTTNKSQDIISIQTDAVPDGVVHLTLFNDEHIPVCERLVFINNFNNNVALEINANKDEFITREGVKLEVQLKDEQSKSLNGNLSMSVRNLEALPHNINAPNIKTWLLLNSDLRGKIENPGYFFSKGQTAKKKYLLDLVMMTNGWRRFTWQELLDKEMNSESFGFERGITISGTTKMLDAPNTEVSTINTITFIGDESLHMESANSKQNGDFSFGPFVFYDSIQTVIESKIADPTIKTQDNYRDVLISLNQAAYQRPDIIRDTTVTNSTSFTEFSDEFMKTSNMIQDLNTNYDEDRQLLDEVVLTAIKPTEEEKRQEEMEERSFFGGSTRKLDVASDEFLSKTQMKFILLRFPGITMDSRFVYYRGAMCLLLFNDMPVDLDYVSRLNPSDISFIEFFDPNNALYNPSRAPGGAFVIYGKVGVDNNFQNTKRQPGIINFNAKGFDSFKEFYAPDYSQELDQMTRTDVRTTLHWEPKIQVKAKNPPAEIDFYTSDLKGTYIIEIQGITDTGIPVHDLSYFSVN